jgi:hypothetical protein
MTTSRPSSAALSFSQQPVGRRHRLGPWHSVHGRVVRGVHDACQRALREDVANCDGGLLATRGISVGSHIRRVRRSCAFA